jgi:murein L,D-transpeptidase YafK
MDRMDRIIIILSSTGLGLMAFCLLALAVAPAATAGDRVAAAREKKGDEVKKLVKDAGLSYPPAQVYIRVYKQEAELEVWARGKDDAAFIKLKTYPICIVPGELGPKWFEGDGQVPEGVYSVNLFNPTSNFHLSLGLDYPNRSDLIRIAKRKPAQKPGGEIFIHGNCVSIGCIPIQDDPIEELYLLALDSKTATKRAPIVHLYPCRMNDKRCQAGLKSRADTGQGAPDLWEDLAAIHAAFEKEKKLPKVEINEKGRYVIK